MDLTRLKLLETRKTDGRQLIDAQQIKWSGREDLNLRPPGPEPGELIFEVPEAEIENTIKVVSEEMEHAAEPAVMLSVPLQVDARAADNWDEAH